MLTSTGLHSARARPHEARELAGPSWARVLTATTARMLLVVVLSLLACAVVPLIFGWRSTTVMSGSMRPAIMPGDIVLARPVSVAKIQPGQILLVRDPDHPGRLRMHRYVGLAAAPGSTGRDLILRGDDNAKPDSTAVKPGDVLGLGSLRVPKLGLPALWIHQRRWGPVAALALGGIVVLAAAAIDGWRPGVRGSHRSDQ